MNERMFTDRTEAGRAEAVRRLFDELVSCASEYGEQKVRRRLRGHKWQRAG